MVAKLLPNHPAATRLACKLIEQGRFRFVKIVPVQSGCYVLAFKPTEWTTIFPERRAIERIPETDKTLDVFYASGLKNKAARKSSYGI